MNIPPTKDERWQIKRLAARVRGLYRTEKQALAFIAETQTMQNGVCSKALTNGEDFGYHRKSMQRGIHGRQRNGKVEYPGLLTRGIVHVTGGHPKGGRAPGGVGLTPAYAINVDVLLSFIPEVDDLDLDPSEKNVDPLVDPNMDPLRKNMDPYVDLMDTSSLSSSLTNLHLPSDQREARADAKSEEIDDDGETHFAIQPEFRADVSPVLPSDDSQAISRTSGTGLEEKTNVKNSGQEDLESRSDAIIAAVRRRQIERKMTDAAIFREYKAVFDRLRKEFKAKYEFEPKSFHENEPHPAGLTFTGGTQKYAENPVWAAMPEGCGIENGLKANTTHCREAAELYRTIGHEAALAQWEDFLVNEDHTTTERVTDNGMNFYTLCDVERTWLLHDFVIAHGVSSSGGVKS